MERAPEPPAADVWRSAAANDARTVDALLSRCAWIDVDAGNELGETLLHVAAARGHDETVRVLLRHRASLTSRDRESGWTPLHRSVYNQHLTTSLLLLRHAQVHHGRKFMRAYLHGTLDFEQQSAMDLLSRRSADALEVEAATTTDKDALRGGMVYTFGKRDYQLGYHLPNADVQSTPRLVELSFASPIRQISASKYHTIALNDAGECFVWGFGKGGRLGTGTEFDHVEPTRIPSLLDIPIAKVAAGENHSLALSRSGQVFSWGSNSFGQLGHNAKTLTHQARLTPKRIDAFKGLVMVEIAASGCHSAAISCEADGGIVYTWGSNKKGQLGRKEGAGTDQPYPTPRPVDALVLNHPLSAIYEDYDAVRATQLALSDWHSCVILRCWRNGKSHGQVWQFGYGSNYPTRINFKDGKRRTGSVLLSDTWIPTWAHRVTDIVQISCAQNHSIALASSGCVYTWGLNESALSHTTASKNMRQRGDDSTGIPGAPQSVDLTKYGPIASICASQDHCAVVTRAGDLVTWGGGAQGVLGHGRENTWQPNPKRVPGVKKAVAVATGHQHTVVLVAPHLPVFPYIRSSEGNDPVQSLMSLSGLLQERLAQWLDISNCATILKYAEDYDARQLQEYCLDYMGRNWDAFLDLMCKERLETLFDMFLPPSEPMELEEKSKKLASTPATTPARSPKPVVTFDGLEALDAFTLGGKMLVKPIEKKKPEMKASGSKREYRVEQTSTGSATPLLSAAKSPKLASFPDPATTMPTSLLTSSAKRKSGKFVPLDHFLSSSKPSTEIELVSPEDLPSAIDRAGGLTSPWGLTRSGPALPVTSPQLQKSVRKGSLDLANAPAPQPRPRKESIGAHPSASPLLSYGQSPLLTSATSGASNKNVLGADGIERPQIAAFSLDAFIKKPSRNSRKGRRGMEVEKDEPKPALSWSGVAAGTSPVSPSFMSIAPPSTLPTSSQFKTLKEIQEEEEARVAAEAAAKTRLGTYSRRNASTVNSWGLCEAQGHISLAEVQKLQEEQAFIEEQRQILAQIEREREAMSKSSSQKSQKKLKGAVRPENHAQKDEERVKKGKKANAKDTQDSASAAGKKSSKPRNSTKNSKSRDESGVSAPKTDKAVSSVEGSAEKRRRKKKPSTEQDATTPRHPTEKKKRPEKKSKRPAKTSEPALQPSVVAA